MPALHGFLAMEYYSLILNRSFVLFTYPEGLYGWKFIGIVSSFTPGFFAPYEDVAANPELAPNSDEFKDLMKDSGSFFIDRSQIASVEYTSSRKWGMGSIPHS